MKDCGKMAIRIKRGLIRVFSGFFLGWQHIFDPYKIGFIEHRDFKFRAVGLLLLFLFALFLLLYFFHQLAFPVTVQLWPGLVDAVFGILFRVGVIIGDIECLTKNLDKKRRQKNYRSQFFIYRYSPQTKDKGILVRKNKNMILVICYRTLQKLETGKEHGFYFF